MTAEQYIHKLIVTNNSAYDHEATARESRDWLDFINSVEPRDDQFQNDFLRQVLDAVQAMSRVDRLNVYAKLWSNGFTLSGINITSLARFAAAAAMTKIFYSASYSPRAMELVRDLFDETEAVIRQFDELTEKQIDERVLNLRYALFARYKYLRSKYPGLIPDQEIGS